MKHILAAIDGSDASYRALEFAAELAQKLDADLTVLIVRLIVVGRREIYAALSQDELQEIKQKADGIARSAGAIKTDVIVAKSRDTAFKIVDVAIDRNADLIVMGASGKGGFKTFLLGSVSQEVLKKSACPVTIVH